MASLTIRVDSTTHNLLRNMAKQLNEPMQAVVAQAVELYRHSCFLERCNNAYAKLKQNPKAWRQTLKERAEWDSTLSDDIE